MSAFLCPCGCGKEVENGKYWATRNCGERSNDRGIYMPKSDCRADERKRKKLYSLKKGKK
jgi:hypothetical protein